MTERSKEQKNQSFLVHEGESREYRGGMVIMRNPSQGVVIDSAERMFLKDVSFNSATIGLGLLEEPEDSYSFQELLWNNVYRDERNGGTVVLAPDDYGFRNRAKFILKYPREISIDRDEIYMRRQRETS